MTGLADCNNFFVSCERTLDSSLEGRAMVVLSNNDGCAIARSNEAKALGVKMGQAAFELRELIRSGKLIALSGNHILYHDISVRIHNIFRRFVPDTLDYSVDEAFLDVNGIPEEALPQIGLAIRESCWREEHIPVTIGFAPTKSLAKIATHIGKKSGSPVFVLSGEAEIREALSRVRLGDLWGVGRRNVKRLYLEGLHTALDFYGCGRQRIRKMLGVTGERLWLELHSTPCIELQHLRSELQDVVSESRTFPFDTDDYDYLKSRISIYASDCARRLRRMKGKCRSIQVYLTTNRFHTENGFVSPSAGLTFETPTSDSSLLSDAAVKVLARIYDRRFRYKRGGVVLAGIVPASSVVPSLFDRHPTADAEADRLMRTIDSINGNNLNQIIKLASQITKGSPGHNDGYSSTFQFSD